MLNSIRKHFGYGQLWPLRPACQNRARSDFLHLIWFRFSKEDLDILCKTKPAPIGIARSGFGQVHLVQEQASVQQPGPVSGKTQPARYQFATFRLGCVLPEMAFIILRKTRLDPIWFWLTVSARFGPNGSGLEASRCARIIWPANGQCFLADSDRMQTRSGMFTGTLHSCNLMMSSQNTAVRS